MSMRREAVGRGCDISVFKKMSFTSPQDRRKAEFSIKSTLESIFKKIRFWLAKTPASRGWEPKNESKYIHTVSNTSGNTCGRSISLALAPYCLARMRQSLYSASQPGLECLYKSNVHITPRLAYLYEKFSSAK